MGITENGKVTEEERGGGDGACIRVSRARQGLYLGVLKLRVHFPPSHVLC